MSNWHENGLDKDLIKTVEAITESAATFISAKQGLDYAIQNADAHKKEYGMSDAQVAQNLVKAVKAHIKELKMDKNKISISLLHHPKTDDLNAFMDGQMDIKISNKMAYDIANHLTADDALNDRHIMLRDSLNDANFDKLVGTPILNLVVQEAKRRGILENRLK